MGIKMATPEHMFATLANFLPPLLCNILLRKPRVNELAAVFFNYNFFIAFNVTRNMQQYKRREIENTTRKNRLIIVLLHVSRNLYGTLWRNIYILTNNQFLYRYWLDLDDLEIIFSSIFMKFSEMQQYIILNMRFIGLWYVKMALVPKSKHEVRNSKMELKFLCHTYWNNYLLLTFKQWINKCVNTI